MAIKNGGSERIKDQISDHRAQPTGHAILQNTHQIKTFWDGEKTVNRHGGSGHVEI